jgi:uncharacterized protein (TIGR02145 family)
MKRGDSLRTHLFILMVLSFTMVFCCKKESVQTVSTDIVFNPNLTYNTLSDIEGNIYKTIQIGSQLWMAENLKTTKYNDGTDIPMFTGSTSSANLVVAGYNWPNYSIDNKKTYGALYDWTVVGTGKLCPSGWHVPSDTEWNNILPAFQGTVSLAGGKLKETGTSHWVKYNTEATNETGFTALPGGLFYPSGLYEGLGYVGHWWSSGCFDYQMFYNLGQVNRFGNNLSHMGFSVRCTKD